MKEINDFKEFKNYKQMINVLYVIIVNFEANNKKCNEKYRGQMHKFTKQKVTSFCYLVHWINIKDI